MFRQFVDFTYKDFQYVLKDYPPNHPQELTLEKITRLTEMMEVAHITTLEEKITRNLPKELNQYASTLMHHNGWVVKSEVYASIIDVWFKDNKFTVVFAVIYYLKEEYRTTIPTAQVLAGPLLVQKDHYYRQGLPVNLLLMHC
mgnify:FL=1